MFESLQDNLKWIYLSYFLVVITSLSLFLDNTDQIWSPLLILIILALHFLFAGIIAINTKNALSKRYTRNIRGAIAIVSDIMLLVSLVLVIIWMNNVSDYNKDSLIPLACIITAFVGNIGCFVLRFGYFTS